MINSGIHRHSRVSGSAGFTLIEMLIGILIVGILAAIAYPGYQQYLLRAQRSAAQSLLLDIHARQEHHFSNAKRYATKLTQLGYPGETLHLDAHGRIQAGASRHSTFQVRLIDPHDYRFDLLAKAIGRQQQDRACAELRLAHTGARGASSDACW